MQILIKYLPKDKLLFELWKAARISPNFYYCIKFVPTLTLDVVKNDINHMLSDKRDIELTAYYGRMLFVNITGDYMDTTEYDLYNGKYAAKKIIDDLKEGELYNTLCTYYKFF